MLIYTYIYGCVRVCEKIASTCGDNDNEQCSPKIEYWGYRMRNGTVYDDDDDDEDDVGMVVVVAVMARVLAPAAAAAASGASDMRF